MAVLNGCYHNQKPQDSSVKTKVTFLQVGKQINWSYKVRIPLRAVFLRLFSFTLPFGKSMEDVLPSKIVELRKLSFLAFSVGISFMTNSIRTNSSLFEILNWIWRNSASTHLDNMHNMHNIQLLVFTTISQNPSALSSLKVQSLLKNLSMQV